MRMAVVARYSATLIAVVLLLSPVPAFAAEDIPPPDEIRYVERDGATSDCIGDPKTPLCAVESWIACDIRGDIELCIRAGQPFSSRIADSPGRGRVLYSVVSVEHHPALEVSAAPERSAGITLIESNTWFADGWYLDNAMVIRSKFIMTRYTVKDWNGQGRWQVTRRIECLGEQRERCTTGAK